jgi:hypothetical protein
MIRAALILPLAFALAVTIDSAGGKLAHYQINQCGA